MRYVLCVAVVIVGIFVASITMRPHPQWTPDGWHYARMMLEFRGEPPAKADRDATDFFLRTNVGSDRKYRMLIARDRTGSFGAVGEFFKLRILYPLLAVPLAGAVGIPSLIVVSLIAYVVAGALVYVLLLLYAPPGLSALGAIVFLASPIVRQIGSSSLVDMLAIAIWFATLYAMLRYAASGARVWLSVFMGASLALSVTRPFLYVPLAGAAALFVDRLVRRDAAGMRTSGILAAIAFALCVGYVVLGASLGSPSLSQDLRWMYRRDLELHAPLPHAFVPWYFTRLLKTVARALGDTFRFVLPIVAIGGFVVRAPREIALFAGVLAGSFLTLLLDPNAGDLARTIEIPLYPIVLAGVVLAWREARYRLTRLPTAARDVAM